MKQRKEFEKPVPQKPEPKKTVQELTEQVAHIVGKNPQKAAQAIESWVKSVEKGQKKAS
jgi:hypothetical protein